MSALKVFFLTLILAATTQAASTGILSAEIPDFFTHSEASLIYRGLGASCQSMVSVKYLLPCNPAFVDSREDKMFSGHIFLGNDYSTVKDINQVINGPHTQEFVSSLFEKKRRMQMEASGEFSFRTRYFGAGFTPYRLTYFSLVRNAAYPQIAVHAMQERTMRIMGGGQVEDNLHAGLQLRYVTREFVQEEFSLYEAITKSDSILRKRKQNVFYVEPGFAYILDPKWKTRTSVLLSNVGFADEKYEEINLDPVWDLGVGFSPPVAFGQWDLGLNYQITRAKTDPLDQVRIGTSYSYGLLSGILGFDRNNWSIGVLTSFWSARAGIVYVFNRVQTATGEIFENQTTFTELSFVF